MKTEQTQTGPRKRGRPRRNDSPPAATSQEGRELSPTHVYINGHGGDGETPSHTKPMALSSENPAQANGNGRTEEEAMDPQDYLIDLKEVTRRTGLIKGSVYYLLKTSNFPLPVEMGQQIKRWWSSEVNHWMRNLPRAKGDLGKWHSQADTKDVD